MLKLCLILMMYIIMQLSLAFVDFYSLWWPCWMLIYKHEPFWQEVIVESLLLRWHFNNFSRITWANCNQSCNKPTLGRSADKGSHPFKRGYEKYYWSYLLKIFLHRTTTYCNQTLDKTFIVGFFFYIKMANCTPLQGDIIVYKFQNTPSSILGWRKFE